MANTKRTAELKRGDIVIDQNGRLVMTIRRVAEAVSTDHMVLFVTGPKGGKRKIGAPRAATWIVSEAVAA